MKTPPKDRSVYDRDAEFDFDGDGVPNHEPDGHVPGNLPKRFYDKEGNVNLTQVTGDDALKYFAAQGIKLPIFPRADGR